MQNTSLSAFFRAAAFRFACASFLATGCGPAPVEHPPTRAIIQDLYQWTQFGLTGSFDSPVLPVSIPSTPSQVPFMGVVTGPQAPPYPTGTLKFKFFGASGPLGCAIEVCAVYSAFGSFEWAFDPAFPAKFVARPSGNYPAGFEGPIPNKKRDMVFAYTDIWTGSYIDFALGKADLPWIYNYEASNIIGSSTAVYTGEGVWVQATADLPPPVTYTWTVNWDTQPWTGSFVYVTFSEPGNRDFVATMKGANGAQVQRAWTVSVMCPPPADPYALVCE